MQIVIHPYFAQLSKNVFEVFHKDIANLASSRKCIFFIIGHFRALLPLYPTARAKKIAGPKNTQRHFFLLGHFPKK